MSVEGNKATVRRLMAEVWHQRKLDVADEVFAVDVVFHRAGDDAPQGLQGFKQGYSYFLSVFPDVRFVEKALIGEGDMIAVRWVMHGTHEGPIHLEGMEIAPTGKQVRLEGMDMFRLTDGKITDVWVFRDDLAPAFGFKYVRQPDPGE